MADFSPADHDSADPQMRIAAIDIGSNSVRLVVAQVLPEGGYRVLDEERENTRLAAVLASSGWLDAQAMDETVAALGNFLSIAQGYGASQVRAIATSAVREAINGRAFRDRIFDELGLRVEVISPVDEGRLAFLSVARAFDISDREVAVADIGGGSTEIVLASAGLVDRVVATRLGAVRVAQQCGVMDVCDDRDIRRLSRFIDRDLKRRLGKPPFTPGMLYGTGGTFTALATTLLARAGQSEQPIWGYRSTRAEIRHLIADLAHLPLEKRSKVTGLNPKRADIIVAGLAVIERVMKYLKINVVQVHTRGVRDGLLLTMIEPTAARSVAAAEQTAAVERFAANCGVDLVHARQVSRLAGSLWEQLAEPLSLAAEDRVLIETAALVANVGYLINFDKHHKHSYHLIANSELPGFERKQLQLLANVARYHRGSAPKQKHENFRELASAEQKRVSQLAAILRLALALDRSHQQRVEAVRANVADGQVEITVEASDDPEVDLWAARRKVELFEKAFGRDVLFSTGAAPSSQRSQSEQSCTKQAAAPSSGSVAGT